MKQHAVNGMCIGMAVGIAVSLVLEINLALGIALGMLALASVHMNLPCRAARSSIFLAS